MNEEAANTTEVPMKMETGKNTKPGSSAVVAAEKPSAWTILSLAVPSLGVLAATPLYMLVDTAVVGRLGTVDLAALGAATTIMGQVTTQLTFLSYGTTARSGRYYGAGKYNLAVREGLNATWLGALVGCVLAVLVWVGAPTLALWLSGQSDVAAEAARWLRVAGIGVPMVLITMAGNGWMRGVQRARLPLVFTLAGVVPAVILVPILVSQVGIVGSAVANLVGESLTMLCFLGYLVRAVRMGCRGNQPSGGSTEFPANSGCEGIEDNTNALTTWLPQRTIIRKQLVLGRDLIARSLCFQISFVSAAAVAGRFGEASLAAHQVLLQVWNFLALVLDSLAIAAQALVGAALGAGVRARARATGRTVIRFSALFGVILAAALGLGHGTLPRLFTTSTHVLSALAIPWWQLVLLVVLGGIVFALDGILLGAGDAAFLRNATMASAVFGFLPLVWLSLFFDWGLPGVWCGLLAFLTFRLITTGIRFVRGTWAQVGEL